MNRKLLNIILFIILSSSLYAQDTTKVLSPSDSERVIINSDSLRTINPDDTARVPPPFIANHKYQYLNISNPDTITRSRFLWMPLKVIEDIFNYLPGYFLNYMETGQVNQLNYSQQDHHYISLLRHGRPLNDLLDGSLDFNLLSRNEIAELEITNGYGNSLYNYSNNINVIQRQLFRFTPYSEISFWQDRFENVMFDGNFHVNFSRKFNFNFGITKHSYDGIYANSDFDKWLGRFNFNYIGLNNFNAFLYVNYAKIQRGLNEGLDPQKLTSTAQEELYNVSTDVINPDAYEIRERFDADMGGIWAYGKERNSFTKAQLFVSNSFRKYRDEENRGQIQPTNGIFISDNSHWIDYGLKFTQNFNVPLTRKSFINSRSEIEYNNDFIYTTVYDLRKSSRIYLLENADYTTENYAVNGYIKAFKHEYFSDKFYFDFGVKPTINFDISNVNLTLFGQYNQINKIPVYQQYFLNNKYILNYTAEPEKSNIIKGGFKLKSANNEFYAEYFTGSVENIIYNILEPGYILSYGTADISGINSNLNLQIFNFEINAKYSYNKKENGSSISYPLHNANIELSYHNQFFRNKLEIKIGFVSKMWSEYNDLAYSGYLNEFSRRFEDTTSFKRGENIIINKNATLDFFISGKISKAVFGITLENILNKASATTGIYPNQQRGGLLNVISRFNVTWYFLN